MVDARVLGWARPVNSSPYAQRSFHLVLERTCLEPARVLGCSRPLPMPDEVVQSAPVAELCRSCESWLNAWSASSAGRIAGALSVLAEAPERPREFRSMLPERVHLLRFFERAAELPRERFDRWCDEELGYWVAQVRKHGRRGVRALRILVGEED